MDYYRGIRALISEGGLFRRVSLKRDNFVITLKNPLLSDLNWVFDFSPFDLTLRECAFVAVCCFSVNGYRVKKKHNADIANYFHEKYSPIVIRYLSRICSTLLDESREAHRYLEAFSYEYESRSIWRAWKANAQLGFKAFDGDVLNDTQASWVAINQMEDEKSKNRVLWEQALLVTSSMNPKGAQEVRKNWDKNDELDEQYRARVCELARQGIFDTEGERESLRRKKDSYDDLKEEMRRWMAGEEDDHDRAVREYKEFMYKQIEDENNRLNEMHEQAESYRKGIHDLHEIRNNQSLTSTPVRAFTDEEINSLSSVKVYKETNEHQERYEHVKERYIMAKETSGNLRVEEGHIVPVSEPSLMDQISKRVPKIP